MQEECNLLAVSLRTVALTWAMPLKNSSALLCNGNKRLVVRIFQRAESGAQEEMERGSTGSRSLERVLPSSALKPQRRESDGNVGELFQAFRVFEIIMEGKKKLVWALFSEFAGL